MPPLLLCNSDPIYYCFWWDMWCAVCILAVCGRALLKSQRIIKTVRVFLFCVCDLISKFLYSWSRIRMLWNVNTHENERTKLPLRIERLAVNEERFQIRTAHLFEVGDVMMSKRGLVKVRECVWHKHSVFYNDGRTKCFGLHAVFNTLLY